jgi:pSer/pThr/pTyr-binding forkhead associated (FHA) protein
MGRQTGHRQRPRPRSRDPVALTILTIGRARRCHVRPHCPLVSKLHCAIARWAGKVTVRDLKSANGTYVNGRRIDGEARVRDGDTISVGSVSFTVRISPSPPGSLPEKVLNEGTRWLLATRASCPRWICPRRTDWSCRP